MCSKKFGPVRQAVRGTGGGDEETIDVNDGSGQQQHEEGPKSPKAAV